MWLLIAGIAALVLLVVLLGRLQIHPSCTTKGPWRERQLSYLEAFDWKIHKWAHTFNVCSLVVLHATVDDDLILESLKELRSRYCVLRSSVCVDEHGKHWFKLNQPSDTLPFVSFTTSKAFDFDFEQSTLEDELNISLPVDQDQLWRFKAWHHSTKPETVLVLTMGHVLTDGKGISVLMKELLDIIFGKSGKSQLDPVPISRSQDWLIPRLVPRPLMAFWSLMRSALYAQMGFGVMQTPSSPPFTTHLERSRARSPPSVDMCRWRNLLTVKRLTAAQTKKLVDTCREQRTTVGSLISIASAAAVAKVAHNTSHHDRRPLWIGVITDLRYRMKATFSDIGDKELSVGIYSGFTVWDLMDKPELLQASESSSSLFEASRRLRKRLAWKMFWGHYFDANMILSIPYLVEKVVQVGEHFLQHGRTDGSLLPNITISNIGDMGATYSKGRPALFTEDELASLPIQSMLGAVNSYTPAPNLILAAYTDLQGRFTLSLTVPSTAFTKDLASDIVTESMNIIERAIPAIA